MTQASPFTIFTRRGFSWTRVSGFSTSLLVHSSCALALYLATWGHPSWTPAPVAAVETPSPRIPVVFLTTTALAPVPDFPRVPDRALTPTQQDVTVPSTFPTVVFTAATEAVATPLTTSAPGIQGVQTSLSSETQVSASPSKGIRPRHTPPPMYPRDMLRQGKGGEVILRVRVNTQGYPVEGEVERSSRHRALDQAALKHILARWTFYPAQDARGPHEAWVIVPILFSPE